MSAVQQETAQAAGDGSVRYYLILDGMDGGSTSARFAHSFEISGFSLDVETPVSDTAGGGVGKADFGPLEIDFQSGTAADEIMRSLLQAKHIKGAQIVGLSASDAPVTVYDLRLSDAIFTNFTQGADLDHLSIAYSKVTVTTPNSAGVGETGGWDLTKATELTTPLTPPTALDENSDGSFGALNWYLSLEGLDGGSTAVGYEGAFELSDFQFSALMAVVSTGSGSGSGKASVNPLGVELDFGSASDEILAYIASGKMLKAAQIEGVTLDGTRVAYDLRLGDVALRDATLVGGGTDRLKIDFTRFSLTTTNALGTAETMNFDRQTNVSGTTQLAEAVTSDENGRGGEGEPVYYLVIDGLDGGSTAKGHKGAFELAGFDLNLKNSGSLSTGGSGSGKTTFGPLDITFDAGSDTTRLLEYLSTGKHIKSVRITGDEMVDGARVSTGFDLRLADLTLASLQQSGGGDALSFGYARYTLTTAGVDGVKETAGMNLATGATLTTPLGLAKPVDHNATTGGDLDYYLVIGGVGGGSTRKGHEGAFAVSDFHFGGANATSSTGGGSGTGKVTFGDLEIDLKLGSAAEDLAAFLAAGKRFKTIQLVGDAGQGKAAETVYDLRLGGALLGAILETGQGQDHLSFSFRQYSLATINDDGKRASYGFDLAKGTSLADELTAPAKPGLHGAAGGDLQYYMTVDGLDGGSTAVKHAFAFALDDLDFTLLSAGKATGALAVTLDIGSAGDELMKLLTTGKIIKNIEIMGDRVTGDTSDTRYDLRLGGVTLTSLGQNAAGDDTIGLQFNRYTLGTRDAKDQLHTSGYDFKAGVALDKAIAAAKAVGDNGSPGHADGYHLMIDGLDGGDRQKSRVGAFDIDDFDFNITAAAASGGGGGVGKATFAPIEITFNAGSAADELLLLAAKGQTIGAVQIVGDVDGERTFRTFDLRLANVHVTDFAQGSGDDTLTLGFDAVSLTTASQSNTGAVLKETYAFDLVDFIGSDQPLPAAVPEI